MISTHLLHLAELLLLLFPPAALLLMFVMKRMKKEEEKKKNIPSFILVKCHLGLFRKLRGC